jgi:hypothetical protein
VTYTLSGTDAGLLSISNGIVTLSSGNLDFDAVGAKKSYSFNVVATDAKSNSTTQGVAVSVTNVTSDDVLDTTGPVFTSVATANVFENQNVLYTAIATDASTPVTYTLSGTDASLLSISNGIVTLSSGNLDFDAVGAKKSYSFDVIATDAKSNASTQGVVVTLLNVTGDEPTALNLKISSTDSVTASSAVDTFIFNPGTYQYDITDFGTGDKLNFIGNPSLSVKGDVNQTDGQQSILIQYPAPNPATITLTLKGLSNADDLGVFNEGSLASVFGSGTINKNYVESGKTFTLKQGANLDISSFSIGDKLLIPETVSVSIVPDSDKQGDGIQIFNAIDSTNTSEIITFTNLTPAQDLAIFNFESLNTVFGAATIGKYSLNQTYLIKSGQDASISLTKGDVLSFFHGASLSVIPDPLKQADGEQAIQVTDISSRVTSILTLTGLSPAQDSGLFNQGSLDTVFGTGTVLIN